MKREVREAILGVATFYAIIVIGVILLNFRLAQINEQIKSATESEVHIAQNINS